VPLHWVPKDEETRKNSRMSDPSGRMKAVGVGGGARLWGRTGVAGLKGCRLATDGFGAYLAEIPYARGWSTSSSVCDGRFFSTRCGGSSNCETSADGSCCLRGHTSSDRVGVTDCSRCKCRNSALQAVSGCSCFKCARNAAESSGYPVRSCIETTTACRCTSRGMGCGARSSSGATIGSREVEEGIPKCD